MKVELLRKRFPQTQERMRGNVLSIEKTALVSHDHELVTLTHCGLWRCDGHGIPGHQDSANSSSQLDGV